MSSQILPLDPSLRSNTTIEFDTALRSKIVGQAEGVQALVDLYQVFCAGLNPPGRPVGNLLFLAPPAPARRAWWKRRRKFCLATRARSLRWIARSFSILTKSPSSLVRLRDIWGTARRIH